eukprot:5054895-Amphidinium_carterae.1
MGKKWGKIACLDHFCKVAKQQRLKRGLKSLRKTFSDATSQKFRNYVAKHLPIVRSHLGLKLPPETSNEFAPFLVFGDPANFRRQVEQVCRANSNEVRGAVVDEMLLESKSTTLHPDAIAFYSGKEKPTHRKHYE